MPKRAFLRRAISLPRAESLGHVRNSLKELVGAHPDQASDLIDIHIEAVLAQCLSPRFCVRPIAVNQRPIDIEQQACEGQHLAAFLQSACCARRRRPTQPDVDGRVALASGGYFRRWPIA